MFHILSSIMTSPIYLNPHHSPLVVSCYMIVLTKWFQLRIGEGDTANTMPPEEHQNTTPAKRAIKKVRTASLVISLARGWQQWACDHHTKQAQEPSGWVPNEEKPLSIPSGERIFPKQSTAFKKDQPEDGMSPPSEQQEPPKNGDQAPSESNEALQKRNIRSKEVAKTIVSKIYERGSGVSLLSDKYEKENGCISTDKSTEDPGDIDKLLSGKMSPTRRRKCSNLVSELTKGWKQIELEDKASELEVQNDHSDSLDTEDSGYWGDTEDRLDTNNSGQEIPSCIRIKRPLSSLTNRSIKIPKNYSPIHNLTGRWEEWADEHTAMQKLNPFSEEFDYELAMSTRLHKGDEGYGHPKEGTKTAERAKRAEDHIHREMKDMCFIIRTMAQHRRDGKIQVTFGDLFERYVRISDKVVGILMRARKHGMLDFEGEMLWQGRDDHVIVTLLE
ncbi:actin-binding Rho-activating protein [Rhineura floridana]|uniref:actin-binding Rho-activating protein n=1 Tax=Rhineura floridana TaxID=261503 RepID=UPI002AC7FE32|nr:actin-binding Rho-activating protein [Rhineura floridana]